MVWLNRPAAFAFLCALAVTLLIFVVITRHRFATTTHRISNGFQVERLNDENEQSTDANSDSTAKTSTSLEPDEQDANSADLSLINRLHSDLTRFVHRTEAEREEDDRLLDQIQNTLTETENFFHSLRRSRSTFKQKQ